MKITNCILNLNRADVAAIYELKEKRAERNTFAIMILVFLGIFTIGPFILTQIIVEWANIKEATGIMDILIVQSIVIAILVICMTTKTYSCGKLFRLLKLNESFDDMVCYLNKLDVISSQVQIAYIMNFHKYLYAYVADNNYNALIIVYEDKNTGHKCYHRTYDYERMCGLDCENAVLMLDIDGVHLIEEHEYEK